MRKILILMGRYLPGHKDGGPLRTVINVTEALGDEYEFYIAALDRDHGDTEPYPNITYNTWNPVGKAKVWYVRPGGFSFSLIRRLARQADLVYTCGFYDDYGYKALILNRLRLLGKPLVVASMGTFSTGALAQKAKKKQLFISLCNRFGLFRNIQWSVTSELEAEDVRKNISRPPVCVIAEDLPRADIPGRTNEGLASGRLRIAFLSRISPKKNLLGAVGMVKKLKCQTEFTVYGPAEDEEYWERCKAELEDAPENIKWAYKGDVPSEEVQRVFQSHDVFLFPTLGENYGHVIFEALSAGCIPVISDQTPWQGIQERNAGFVLALDDPDSFTMTLEQIAAMPGEMRNKMAENAVMYAREKLNDSRKETGYRKIFG